MLSDRLTGAPDIVAFELACADLLIAELAADRAGCDFFDSANGWLWSEHTLRTAGDERRADRGVLGRSATRGVGELLEHAERSPHWDPIVDASAGPGRLLTQPVHDRDGHVHAVLWAARDATRSPFGEDQLRRARALAELAGPLLVELAAREAPAAEANPGGLFRREALEALTAIPQGEPLRGARGRRGIAAGLAAVAIAAVALAFLPVNLRRTSAALGRGGTLDVANATPGMPIRFVATHDHAVTFAIATTETSAVVLGWLPDGSEGVADMIGDSVRLYTCVGGGC